MFPLFCHNLYLCEAAMSALVNIETTYRNRLRVANDVRIALSSINPRIDELVSETRTEVTLTNHLCCVLSSKL